MDRGGKVFFGAFALLISIQTSVAVAETLPVVQVPFGWTSTLGSIDLNSQRSRKIEATVAWNAGLATYNLTPTAQGASNAYVFFASGAPQPEIGGKANRLLENLRVATVPAPAAWWLLICGIVGLVGVARRRTV